MMGKEEDFLEIRPTGRDSSISVIFYEAHHCGGMKKKKKKANYADTAEGKSLKKLSKPIGAFVYSFENYLGCLVT